MYLQPTGTYGVPPVEVSDARPRYQGDPRPPSYGYYPPQQRVMPRVSRKYFMKCFFRVYTRSATTTIAFYIEDF